MREVTVKVYKFDELSREVKDKLIYKAQCEWEHENYYYTELLDEARRGSEVYVGLDYLMEYMTGWEVDYNRARVSFYGDVDIYSILVSDDLKTEINKAIERGDINSRYKEEKHLNRLLDYIENNASFYISEGRRGLATDFDSPQIKGDVYNVCHIIDNIIYYDVNTLQTLLEADLFNQFEFINSEEYIIDVYQNIDDEYLEDGTIFNH